MLDSIKPRVSFVRFMKDLWKEIQDDNVFNGAAALAYFLTLAVFPSMIVMLAVIPFLPIPNLDQEIMSVLRSAMPDEAANMFNDVVTQVTSNRQEGLLSFGLLLTLWAASNGMIAIMQHLNITYDVKEGRSFFKVRATAFGLMISSFLIVVSAFGLVLFGGPIISWLTETLGLGSAGITIAAVIRWAAIALAIMFAIALVYYKGPDVKQKFKFITPGSVIATAIWVGASVAFKFYVNNFGKYSATYGSIGAVIIFMFWLYVSGVVLLLGSEINALFEHYAPEGKLKGEKKPDTPARTRAA